MQTELPGIMEKKFSEFADVKDIHLLDGALQTKLETYDFNEKELHLWKKN